MFTQISLHHLSPRFRFPALKIPWLVLVRVRVPPPAEALYTPLKIQARRFQKNRTPTPFAIRGSKKLSPAGISRLDERPHAGNVHFGYLRRCLPVEIACASHRHVKIGNRCTVSRQKGAADQICWCVESVDA